MRPISPEHMTQIQKRAERSPDLLKPYKGGRCLICGTDWHDCPHSIVDVLYVAQEVENRRMFSSAKRSDK